MTIDCTDKELHTLLRALYLAEWVTNANHFKVELSAYEQLEQPLLAMARDRGMKDVVDPDPGDDGLLYATRGFTERDDVHGVIEEYDTVTFEQEFASRLAERDFLRQTNREQRRAMAPIDRMEALDEREDEYIKELKTFGVSRLVVDEGNRNT